MKRPTQAKREPEFEKFDDAVKRILSVHMIGVPVMPNGVKQSGVVIPELKWEYRGEGLYIYWHNPFDGDKKQDVLMFMWPTHPVEDTAKVEATYEAMAASFVAAAKAEADRAVLLEALKGLVNWYDASADMRLSVIQERFDAARAAIAASGETKDAV